MKRGALLAVLPALIAAQSIPEGNIFRLRWLQGEWVQVKGGKTTTEKWELDEDDALSGSSRTGDWSEKMKIAPGAGGKTWLTVAQPGKNPVQFRLVKIGPQRAIFSNPQHDYPQIIAYRRDAAGLHATISLTNGRRSAHWHYQPARR